MCNHKKQSMQQYVTRMDLGVEILSLGKQSALLPLVVHLLNCKK